MSRAAKSSALAPTKPKTALLKLSAWLPVPSPEPIAPLALFIAARKAISALRKRWLPLPT